MVAEIDTVVDGVISKEGVWLISVITGGVLPEIEVTEPINSKLSKRKVPVPVAPDNVITTEIVPV
jgi:hypothetical protein